MTLVVWLPCFCCLGRWGEGELRGYSLLTVGVHLVFSHCAVVILKIISECEQEKNEDISETLYCLNVKSFLWVVLTIVSFHLWEISKAGYWYACGYCVSTYLLYFQPVKPFHQRSLRDMIQDNYYFPQTLWFFPPFKPKVQRSGKDGHRNRLRHKQTVIQNGTMRNEGNGWNLRACWNKETTHVCHNLPPFCHKSFLNFKVSFI